mmetsp:Transcript_3050/g.8885  ORF Transcript_3050/g.8885 Transcript_3050/m.8885 type:complete len:349 (-) Transcript_3050:178-1224(-)
MQVRVWVARAALAHGHVVVDDECDRGHVDAAGEHVGRDKEASGAGSEVNEHLVSRRSLHAPVEWGDGVTVGRERLGELVYGVAHVHEDDALPHVDHGEDLGEALELLCHAVCAVEVLGDLVVEDVFALHLDLGPRVIHGELRGQPLHGLRVGRGEEEGLHVFPQALADALGLVPESAEHEHLVRLVKNKHADGRRVENSHVQQGDDLARRANNDLLLEALALLPALLAQNALDLDALLEHKVLAHLEHLVLNLLGELARGADAQRLGRGVGRDDAQHAQHEAARLSGAVVRLGQQVAAHFDLGQRRGLDLGRARELHLVEALEDERVKLELRVLEGGDGHGEERVLSI